MIPNYGYSNSTYSTSTTTGSTVTCDAFVTVWINGHPHTCPFDRATGTVFLPTGVPGGSTITVSYGHDDFYDNTTEFIEEVERFGRELKRAFIKAPWEIENWSLADQLRVGSPREGVRRPPPLNRPMRRERRPPSWMRRRR
jgi:hypothetical protein